MDIFLQNLGKRFNREEIFKELNFHFRSNRSYALTGSNGSGKSTLLQIIAGNMLASKGEVLYQKGNSKVTSEDIFKHISIAAPYLELIEEFTLLELVSFHFKFKSTLEGETIDSILEHAYLWDSRNKSIKNFSSGMKQRLKLMLAFYSDTPILLLDEPTSNLDKRGVDWYLMQIDKLGDRTTIIASNQDFEYSFCNDILRLEDFK